MIFTNRLGEALAPFLLWLRGLGFLEWYVYMPIMALASIGMFWSLTKKLNSNGTFSGSRAQRRTMWLAAYYGLCFLATNVLAVAFKTLIVEELDYPTRVWFEAYVGPLHFFILSVIIAYLAVLVRNSREVVSRVPWKSSGVASAELGYLSRLRVVKPERRGVIAFREAA